MLGVMVAHPLASRCLLAVAMLTSTCWAFGQVQNDRYIVEFEGAATQLRSNLDASGFRLVKTFGSKFAVVAASSTNPKARGSSLATVSGVLWANPDRIVSPARRPNDSLFPNQWHHAKISSERAWDISTGQASIKIAICDSGVNGAHPDLASRMVPGFNAVDNLAQASGGQVNDLNGHGTHVAGCAASAGNNSEGVSGMGWGLQIMPVRVSNASSGNAFMSDILAGATWAAQNGAKVVNASYSGVGDPSVEPVSAYLRSIGALFVWSAGNDSAYISFAAPNTIIVGATTQSDTRASFSNYGPAVDVMAPGVSILSTVREGAYGYKSGTSMAAPIVSGLLGLLWSVSPTSSPNVIEDNLMRGCTPMAATRGRSTDFGWGRIDAFKSARRSVPYSVSTIPTPSGYASLANIGIAANGTVFGYTRSPYRAFTHKAGVTTVLDRLSGWLDAVAYGANDFGTLVGAAADSVFDITSYRPAKWVNGFPSLLPNPVGFANGYAADANRFGDIVALAYNGNPNVGQGYVIVANQGSPSIRVLNFGAPFTNSSATRINDAGEVAGRVGTSTYQPAWWDASGNPTVYPPVFGYMFSQFTDLNNAGEFIAQVQGPSNEVRSAYRTKLTDFEFLDVKPGLLANAPVSINDFSQIAGIAWTGNEAGSGTSYGVLWLDRYQQILNDVLAPAASGWFVTECLGLDNDGNILGRGRFNGGAEVPILLSPTLTQGQGSLPVNCSVMLEGVTDPTRRPLTLEIYQDGQLIDVLPNLVPNANGQYDVNTFARGTCDLYLTAPSMLGKRISNVGINRFESPTITASLKNGDCDGDNEVTILDYLALSSVYGLIESDAGFDVLADLDSDGEISILDYLLLSGNYEAQGDPRP
jgi:subtilisin family serine protease